MIVGTITSCLHKGAISDVFVHEYYIHTPTGRPTDATANKKTTTMCFFIFEKPDNQGRIRCSLKKHDKVIIWLEIIMSLRQCVTFLSWLTHWWWPFSPAGFVDHSPSATFPISFLNLMVPKPWGSNFFLFAMPFLLLLLLLLIIIIIIFPSFLGCF